MKNKYLSGVATSAVLLAFAGPSIAADLPVKAPPLAAPPALYNWTGFYIGGHLGWGRTKYNGTWFGDSDTFAVSEKPDGILGGAQIGYNWQVNNTFVLGLEGDVSFLNWETDTFHSPTDSGEDTLGAKLNLLASLRGRLGLAFDRALLYATGGLGYAHGKVHAFDVGGPPTTFDESFSKWGGVVGGGVEYAFTNNLIGRVEGLYYFFDRSTTFIGPADTAVAEIKDAGVIRGALSYKFNP